MVARYPGRPPTEDENRLASQAYEQILRIQGLDVAIMQLRHRSDGHPVRARLGELDAALAEHDESVAVIEQRRHELQREQKRLDDEVASIEARRRDVDGKLYGGQVTASKELLALQDEAASLLDRQTRIEDDDLVVMERVEEIEGELADLADRRAELERQRAESQAELDTALAEIRTELEALEAERTVAVEPASAELLERYESLRSQFDGVPVARLVNGRCDGCHIQLSAVAVDRMAKMADDAVVTCEECGRLLVR